LPQATEGDKQDAPIFYWLCFNTLLSKINQADLLLARKKRKLDI